MADETVIDAPAVDPTPSASEASVSPVTEPATSPTPSPPAPEFPAPDTFGWDDWDGKHDALPEPVRGWAPKFEAHYSKESKAVIAEANELRELYERLSAGVEDPRLAKTKAEYETYKAEQERKQAENEQKFAEHEEYRAAVIANSEARAAEQVESFKSKYGWIFDSGKVEALASELVDEGFGQDVLPVALRLPDSLLTEARRIAKDLNEKNVPDAAALALRIAKSEAKFAPTPSEDLQAGPGNRVTSKVTTELPASEDFMERRKRAIDKANAAVRNG